MEAEKLMQEFSHRAIIRGGEFYLPKDFTEAFLRRADESDVAVTGAEAAILEENATVSQFDLILDLYTIHASDWESFRRECNKESQQFLASLPTRPNLYVSFALVDRTEWMQGRNTTP